MSSENSNPGAPSQGGEDDKDDKKDDHQRRVSDIEQIIKGLSVSAGESNEEDTCLQRSQGAVKKRSQGGPSFSDSRPSTSRQGDGTPRETLKEMMARKKQEMQQTPPPVQEEAVVNDPYANASASVQIVRGHTGICHDNFHRRHRCKWDNKYPENPNRVNLVFNRIKETGLYEMCYKIENAMHADLYQKITRVHSEEHFANLQAISTNTNAKRLEEISTEFDSVYFCSDTFDAACRAVSVTLNLVMSVAGQTVLNGIAVVRPPGHHAMTNEYNGYCYFNNVAIAAEACIKEKLASKILIVDVDVHHGQGIQQMFYDRNDVLYFSIHRYEHGTFWPNLPQSNFNYIGRFEGKGYNVNVPLNATGLTDDDYFAIVFNLLLPIAYEYDPDLVIICAGYDAAVGCPEGRMNVTPGFYAHLVSLLSCVAKGRLAVVLEGGYFLPTLAEGACMTLKALLGGPCPMLEPIRNVHPAVVEVICNVKRMLMSQWNCFKHVETIPLNQMTGKPDEHKFIIQYHGYLMYPPYPTRNCYPELSKIEQQYFKKLNLALREKYQAPVLSPVVYVYDETMILHKPKEGELERPEKPERLTAILQTFSDFGLEDRLIRMPVETYDFRKYNPHNWENFHEFISSVNETNDVYLNEFTELAAVTAISSVMTVVDTIMEGTARSGLAVIRPPGHHADHDKAMGFCFINNIAVAATYLRDKYQLSRILIVDFDVHHGNGTQNIFYNTDNIMYISIHRDDGGKFFPVGSHRHYTNDGYGMGKGFNINIPFSKDKMGDSEYIAAFHNIILPAAYSYGPQMVLISAGFDAGVNDPLGGYRVSPETFGHFVAMLKPLAEGHMVVVLEGGYNLATTSYGMAMCAKALLGDPMIIPRDLYKNYSKEACKTINEVAEHLKQYYDVFKANKKVSLLPLIMKRVDKFTSACYVEPLYKELDIERVEYSDYVEWELQVLNGNTYEISRI